MTSPTVFNEWEAVIGLEVHVALNTHTKLFSAAPNRFGDDPNTNITDVCTGQPGTLPVLNKEAVRKAVTLGLALNASIAHYSRFDRKSYFYPDSPRNYQITQYEMPLILGGEVIADVDGVLRSFAIHHAHLEDDAGTLKHYPTFTTIDYNRAGVPLIEIVSEPCMFSPKEARAYATALKAILEYLDLSDCDMEKGSLRIDANLSVRPKGETTLRPKIEIKNMNSFAYLEMALEGEMKRQIAEYARHRDQDVQTVIERATYRWDPDLKRIVFMRKKETADDYRYFPEPDLPPVILDEVYIDSLRKTMGELPHARRRRYIEELGLPVDATTILIEEKRLSDYFERGLATTKNARGLCNWIVVEFVGRLRERHQSIWESSIPPEHIAELVSAIDNGRITGKIAKGVADLMIEHPTISPDELIRTHPEFVPVTDTVALEGIIDRVLADNAGVVADYKNGKGRAFDYLVGQVMRATQGKAAPHLVHPMLTEKLKRL